MLIPEINDGVLTYEGVEVTLPSLPMQWLVGQHTDGEFFVHCPGSKFKPKWVKTLVKIKKQKLMLGITLELCEVRVFGSGAEGGLRFQVIFEGWFQSFWEVSEEGP